MSARAVIAALFLVACDGPMAPTPEMDCVGFKTDRSAMSDGGREWTVWKTCLLRNDAWDVSRACFETPAEALQFARSVPFRVCGEVSR